VKKGLPRFAVPSMAEIKPEYSKDKVLRNAPPAQGIGMVYYGSSQKNCNIWP
jgi:hypothetical protein